MGPLLKVRCVFNFFTRGIIFRGLSKIGSHIKLIESVKFFFIWFGQIETINPALQWSTLIKKRSGCSINGPLKILKSNFVYYMECPLRTGMLKSAPK